MEREAYKTKNGEDRFRPVITEEEYRSLTYDSSPGFCLSCGLECDGVEPDAKRYECESCGVKLVYGLEELLLMGLLNFKGDE